jgi:hypothetical protein
MPHFSTRKKLVTILLLLGALTILYMALAKNSVLSSYLYYRCMGQYHKLAEDKNYSEIERRLTQIWDSEVCAAIFGLCTSSDPLVVDILVRAAHHPKLSVRRCLADTLIYMQPTHARRIAEVLINDPDQDIRNYAQACLLPVPVNTTQTQPAS